METIIEIGFEFKMRNRIWKVTTTGIDNWWGVICLSSHSFISMSTEDILSEIELQKDYDN